MSWSSSTVSPSQMFSQSLGPHVVPDTVRIVLFIDWFFFSFPLILPYSLSQCIEQHVVSPVKVSGPGRADLAVLFSMRSTFDGHVALRVFTIVTTPHFFQQALSTQLKWLMWLSWGPITRVTASTHCGFGFGFFSHFFALGTIAVWGHLFITCWLWHKWAFKWRTISVASTLWLAAMLHTFSQVAPTMLFCLCLFFFILLSRPHLLENRKGFRSDSIFTSVCNMICHI